MEDKAPTLNCNHEAPIVYENHGQDSRIKEVQKCPSIKASAGTGGGNLPIVQCFHENASADCRLSEKSFTIGATSGNAGGRQTGKVMINNSIRRLTPKECSRLQGFPDGYLDIDHKGKPAVDGPKYKAIGNSWAVPVITWIGKRMEEVNKRNL